jgi:glutaredoxin
VPTIDLYGRAGCHLCEDARARLVALQPELDFIINDIDIEADDELHRRYLERIPVVVLDGEHLFDFFVDEAVLRERLGTVGDG